ncbi:Chitinase domain-containing protein 1 [Chionoecetes opilio]|uniref:Chitinase domain-containing protein 1 n=1 Tax=Chionoecetes opilio TaxID=41210 RepID=A0A8J4Y1R7_CHIOP|nr:Chitinase domain-containing protein 1 [Chionoecetes opilio]
MVVVMVVVVVVVLLVVVVMVVVVGGVVVGVVVVVVVVVVVTGQVESSVDDRGLVTESPKWKDIVDHHARFHHNTAHRNVDHMTLAYVTPWNNHGYDVVKLFGGKFSHVSPVWLQLRHTAGQTLITGDHDVDQGWLTQVKKAGKTADVKIVPRLLFDGWQPRDFRELFDTEPKKNKVINDIINMIKDLIADGHLSPDMSYLVCDPNKLRRARQDAMASARDLDQGKHQGTKIVGLGYDGRKDKTRAMVPDSYGKLHPRLIREEHVSVTEEPSGRYPWHFVPEDPVPPEKPAFKVAQALYDLLVTYDSTDSLIVLQGDSTRANTGWKGGTHAHLEKMLGRKLFWSICVLHTNELPLRHQPRRAYLI